MGIASGLAWYYKPEITQVIHRKLGEKINGEFDIRNISISIFEDFPNVSIKLEGIDLRGARYPLYKKDFFKAKKVLVNVSLSKLLAKEIEVKSIKIVQGDAFIF